MEEEIIKPSPETYHRFLDEAGDTVFYGKSKTPVIGTREGVSLCFVLGMVKIRLPLESVREAVRKLQKEVEQTEYFRGIPSIQKKIVNGGYYFHASEDIPEARKIFYEYIKSLDCSFEAVVGRKITSLFIKKHNGNESEFYADLLSHLLKNKLRLGDKLVLNVAARGKTTRNETLQMALDKAMGRYRKKSPEGPVSTNIVFNVQNQTTEPLLNVADYFCWTIQRIFERGETRYYNFLSDKISLVIDLYDSERYEGSKNYYTKKNPLTAENKLSPPLY